MTANPEELLAHADFVRRLALNLAKDEHRAADIAQETYLSALRHPPEAGEAIRGWFARVARNARARLHRNEARRWRREGEAAVPDIVPPTEEIVEREEIRARVVRAVLDLPEPYRSTMLLRFYEDLPPRKIAGHFEVPVETVRTRIKKGLALLRARLDAEHGNDRNRWLLALLPAAGALLPASGASASTTVATLIPGAIAMTVKWKLALAVLILLGAAFGLWKVFLEDGRGLSGESRDAGVAAGTPFDTAALPGEGNAAAREEGAPERTGPDARSGNGNERALVEARGALVEGMVKDEAACPVAWAVIFLKEKGKPAAETAESGPEGSFVSARIPPGSYEVYAEAGDHLRSLRQAVELFAGERHFLELTVGPWYEISGKVLSHPEGVPLPGARIKAGGVGEPEEKETISGEDGAYRLEDLLRTSYLLEASTDGYGSQVIEGIPAGTANADFGLARPGILKGTVKAAGSGVPVENFHIELWPAELHPAGMARRNQGIASFLRLAYHAQRRAFGRSYTFDSRDGTFEIDGLAQGEYLMAAAAEFYAFCALKKPVEIRPGEETAIEIALSSGISLRGRVEDASDGTPIRGAWVRSMAGGPAAQGFDLVRTQAVTTDRDGCFDFPHASEGMNALEAGHAGYRTRLWGLGMSGGKPSMPGGRQEGVSLEGAAVIVRLEKMETPGRIAVTLGRDLIAPREDPPLIGILGIQAREIAVPDAAGSYLTRPLEPGLYNVLVMAGGEVVDNRALKVEEGRTSSIHFGSEERVGCRILGKVTAGSMLYSGEGWAILERSMDAGDQPVGMATLKNGEFSFSGLEPASGELNVVLQPATGNQLTFTRKIAWDVSRDRLVELSLLDTGLRVRILDSVSRTGIPGAQILLKPEEAQDRTPEWTLKGSSTARTGEDGTVLIRHLPPGTYAFQVIAGEYASKQGKVEIRAPGETAIEVMISMDE